MSKYIRPSWHEYFFQICYAVAQRSTCIRRKVGAIAVKEKQILSTGYNGTASDLEHCFTKGCLRQIQNIPSGERHEFCRGIHAEQNVIIQAARFGTPIQGATIYCTTQPCSICAKILINAGIKEIYYTEEYPDRLSDELLNEANIPCLQYEFKPFAM